MECLWRVVWTRCGRPQVAQARYMSNSLYVDLTRAICTFIRICMGKITIVSVTYENVTI